MRALPKWAQGHITNLERDRKRLEATIATMNGGEDSPVSFGTKGMTDHGYLPDMRINFQLGDQVQITVRMRGHRKGDGGRPRININCSEQIIIRPGASNSLDVEPADVEPADE